MSATGEHDVDPVLRARGRRTMLIVLAICAAPFVFGTIAFYWWTPPRSTNYGELLALSQPKLNALTNDGKPLDLQQFRNKWVLVTVDRLPCDDSCEKKLFLTRQVRVAQGRDQERVARLWLTQGAVAPGEKLQPLVDQAVVARLAVEEDPARTFGATPLAHVYVIDPQGNLMMRFPSEPNPSRVIKDLQKLLRVNNRGS
jgi:cytochrome oxidase Cu insertion factor (SCO1/SenC/PrrC family)